MNILEQVYNKRKHPAVYSDENVPTKKEILDIVGKAYPLVTSFRKAFGYQIHILGPNKERSEKIWSICENHKQGIDDEEYGKENAMKFNGDVINDTIVSGSVGLLHIRSAPWTLIATPRVCYPNAYHSDDNTSSGLEETDGKSVWEFADYEHMNTWNRESGALEIAMFLKIKNFIFVIEKHSSMLMKESHFEVAGSLLDDVGYTEMLQNEKTPGSEGRLENLKKLIFQIFLCRL